MKTTDQNIERPDEPRLGEWLLAWYDRDGRSLPWRAAPGTKAAPYHVWLSEIMLQQTTVATVGPYFRTFLARWPRIEALAEAELDAVLHAWQGLGYYARARNLHRCAARIVAEHEGRFPETESELQALPGIGPYTAAAISAIAFDRPATPVDGNVERVMARLFAVETPLPDAKPLLRQLARRLTPTRRPGDHAQAVMDLGATVCRPKAPLCERCPWASACNAKARGLTEVLPARRAKRPRPLRHGVSYWIRRGDGAVLLRRRPETGLLGGMMELPSTEWRSETWSELEALASAPLEAEWRALPGEVAHGFTHFRLSVGLLAAAVDEVADIEGTWCGIEALSGQALPTLTKKLIRHALDFG